MDWLETWTNSIDNALSNLINQVAGFLPDLLSAILIFIVGLIVAAGLKGLIVGILHRIKFGPVLDRIGFNRAADSAGVRLDLPELIGTIVQWFVIFIFLIAVADILNMPAISEFIGLIAGYIPNVVAAAVILIIGIVVASLLSDIVTKAASASGVAASNLVGGVAKWAVLIFTFFAVLTQLNIASELIQILFAGIVVAVSLALGLAFGLGGRETAQKFLDQSLDNTSSKRR